MNSVFDDFLEEEHRCLCEQCESHDKLASHEINTRNRRLRFKMEIIVRERRARHLQAITTGSVQCNGCQFCDPEPAKPDARTLPFEHCASDSSADFRMSLVTQESTSLERALKESGR